MSKELKSLNVWKLKQVKSKTIKVELGSVERAQDVANIMEKTEIYQACEEYFYIICMATNGDVIGVHQVSHGTTAMCPVSPKEVFKRAMLNNATSIILVHNHPSGNLTPSHADIKLTDRLISCGKLMDIQVLDHIIVDGYGDYTSLRGEDICEF